MARRVSVAEARARLSTLINQVAFGGQRVLIESRGKPKAALVGLDDLRRLEAAPAPRPSPAQRKLALVQADRVREALRGFALTDPVAELARLRRARVRDLS